MSSAVCVDELYSENVLVVGNWGQCLGFGEIKILYMYINVFLFKINLEIEE